MTLTSSTVLTEPLSAVKQGLLLSEMASASSAIADNKNVFYVDTSIPPILDDGPFRFWHEKRMIRWLKIEKWLKKIFFIILSEKI